MNIGNEKRKKDIVIMGYIVFIIGIIYAISRGNIFESMLGIRALPSLITMVVAGEYFETIDLPFEYMGSRELDVDAVDLAEWRYILGAEHGESLWTFVIDSEEEFMDLYGNHGVDENYVEDFDFENYILLISANSPISAVRISERDRMWDGDMPYVCAEFTYKTEYVRNRMYYHRLPRKEFKFCRKGEIITRKLHIYATPYEKREKPAYGSKQIQFVDSNPFWPKWGWAFSKFNTV